MTYTRYIARLLPFGLLLLSFIINAETASDYLLVKDLPFISETADLSGYLRGIFRLGIGLAVVLSVFMIVYNGITYMMSDVVTQKGAAKAGIRNAIWGLVLVLASVLILNTINPEIVQFRLVERLLELSQEQGGPSGGGGDTEEEPSQEEALVRQYFESYGVGINNPPCTEGQTKGCTNVAGLPLSTRTAIVNLARACGTTGCVVITGGSEGGHQTHGIGKPFADLRKTPALSTYIQQNGTFIRDTPIGKLYQLGAHQMLDETVGDPHWHGCFNTSCNIAS